MPTLKDYLVSRTDWTTLSNGDVLEAGRQITTAEGPVSFQEIAQILFDTGGLLRLETKANGFGGASLAEIETATSFLALMRDCVAWGLSTARLGGARWGAIINELETSGCLTSPQAAALRSLKNRQMPIFEADGVAGPVTLEAIRQARREIAEGP